MSEKSTEDNYKNIPTMEDMELSFSPVKITPRSDMDASPIDHVLVTPEDEFKNVKVSGKLNLKFKFPNYKDAHA